METRARYILIGLFTLSVVVAGFIFVYWIEKSGSLTSRALYAVRFQNSVAGMWPGSPVQFDGVRVGEVTRLNIDPAAPSGVIATISIDPATPVRADTKVTIDFQGITGTPAISLTGGAPDAPPVTAREGGLPLLYAEPNAGQGLSQAARDTLRRIDALIEDNSKPLSNFIKNVETFSDALSRNSSKVDGILTGLERMTAGAKVAATIYDLPVPRSFPDVKKTFSGQLVVNDPTVALAFDNDKIVVNPQTTPPLFSDARWSDTLSKLVQTKVIQGFENAGFTKEVARGVEGMPADFKLLIEVRSLQILTAPTPAAEVTFSARIVNAEDKIIDGKVFSEKVPVDQLTEASGIEAVKSAFSKALGALVPWTIEQIGNKS